MVLLEHGLQQRRLASLLWGLSDGVKAGEAAARSAAWPLHHLTVPTPFARAVASPPLSAEGMFQV